MTRETELPLKDSSFWGIAPTSDTNYDESIKQIGCNYLPMSQQAICSAPLLFWWRETAMETKFNFDGKYLYMPVAFREDFNNFAPISQTQAWSLFFTGSRDDLYLGQNAEAGRFWTNLTVGAAIASALAALVFNLY